jgi:branched-chain amino acid transport system substrate-binding protein
VVLGEYIKREKIPLLSNCMTEELTLKQGHRYVFRAVLNTGIQGKATARFVYNKWSNKKKIFLFCHDFEYGRMAYKSFWESLKKFEPDVELVGEAWPKMAETEYSNYWASIIRANPDIVFTALARNVFG